jgi:hypothetical protein
MKIVRHGYLFVIVRRGYMYSMTPFSLPRTSRAIHVQLYTMYSTIVQYYGSTAYCTAVHILLQYISTPVLNHLALNLVALDR